MNNVMDLHTHTLASGHAYNTIIEMAKEASEKGIKMLGITEHAPKMPETCGMFYFSNLRVVEREMFGVELFMGVELNILDYDGTIDMPEEILKEMDITIASMHRPCIIFGSKKENTRAVVKCLENKNIDMIGHPDDNNYSLDYEEIAKVAKEQDKLLEVNAASFLKTSFRIGAIDNYKEMLKQCEKNGTKVIVNSDAHFMKRIGECNPVFELIREINFPKELIMNDKPEDVKKYLKKYKDKR